MYDISSGQMHLQFEELWEDEKSLMKFQEPMPQEEISSQEEKDVFEVTQVTN
jgi:hypothetical protein